MTFLDLSENRLSGEIPSWIGESLENLIFLSLQSNEFFGNIPLRLCQLKNIQILDLSQNNLSGSIPKCISNLTAMVEKGDSENVIAGSYIAPAISEGSGYGQYYINKGYVDWKGRQCEYERILGLLKLIDFGGNKLCGEIPEEITNLLQLVALNLSRNNFTGVIPQKIGQLEQLEVLDLSRNQLSGAIPMSMADLNFLSLLDLSYNYLSGKIPSSTQLQSFDASAFDNNLALCGPPLIQACPGEDHMPDCPLTNDEKKAIEENVLYWFYIGSGTGFIASFWGVSGTLLLKSSWRNSLFRFMDESRDWLYVTTALCKKTLLRKSRASFH